MRRGPIIAIIAIAAVVAAVGVALIAGGGGNDAVAPASEPTQQALDGDSADEDSADGDEDSAPVDEDTNGEPNGIAIDQIPGDPRAETPSALENMDDPAFPEPLVDPAEIRSGGPPPDGIPPIDSPIFQPVGKVDWLEDNEPVLLLEIGGEARAYPVQIMIWHEIVNDTFGDLPVTVSYCPLCNSAITYVRQAGGRTLDFGTSGRLYQSSLVMYDRQTESLWSHFTGEAVVGTLTGTTLETLPITTTSWATFQESHPDGLVLSRSTGFVRDYGRNPYPGYDDVEQNPFLFDGELDDRLPAQTRVVAIRGQSESVAVPLDDLAEAGVVTTTIDDSPIVILHAPGTTSALDAQSIADGRDIGTVGVYRIDPDDGIDLQADGTGSFVDTDDGSVFNVLGTATDGEREGDRLEPVEHLDTFWFAIAAFEPDTRIATG